MALVIEDRVEDTIERARWRGKDSVTNAFVAVTVSHEALQDNGETACLDKAVRKYSGSSPVDVTTSDF